jgi:AraC-like DNA-binding protein
LNQGLQFPHGGEMGKAMYKIVFSSDDLPPGLDDQARFSAWRDFFANVNGPLEVSCLPDRPFSQRLEAARFDSIRVMRLRGTTDRIWWTSPYGVARRSPDFYLCLNRDHAPMSLAQMGCEADFDYETAVLGSCTESYAIRAQSANDFSVVVLPQTRLRELVAGVEDLLARRLRSDAALCHLRRYLDILAAPDDLEGDPQLIIHVERTLMDLVALALGARRDEIPCMRGLRAARLHEIIAEIRMGFAEPAFSAQSVARKVGVTTRYVQDLLQETGTSFTERVLELRLQRARAMLTDPRYDRLRVGEIASACGFNEIPHFNRCFRRRFGATPAQFRGGGMV